MPFTAGQKLRAVDLNAVEDRVLALETVQQRIVTKRLAADVSKANSIVMTDVTGISFALLANTEYLADGFLSWYAATGIDMRIAYTGPVGMTCSWALTGPPPSNVAVAGPTDWPSLEVYGDANAIALNTDTAFALGTSIGGYWRTGATAGTLTMRYSQLTTSASPLSVKRGTWMRLQAFA